MFVLNGTKVANIFLNCCLYNDKLKSFNGKCLQIEIITLLQNVVNKPRNMVLDEDVLLKKTQKREAGLWRAFLIPYFCVAFADYRLIYSHTL